MLVEIGYLLSKSGAIQYRAVYTRGAQKRVGVGVRKLQGLN